MKLDTVVDDEAHNERPGQQRDRPSHRRKYVKKTPQGSKQAKIKISIPYLGREVPKIWRDDTRVHTVNGLQPKDVE